MNHLLRRSAAATKIMSRICGVTITVVAVVTGTPAPSQGAANDSLAQLTRRALDSIAAARYGDASDLAQKIITSDPGSAVGYDVRGMLGLFVGSWTGAQVDFNVAHAFAPADAYAQYGLALAALHRHDLVGASRWVDAGRRAANEPERTHFDLLRAALQENQGHASAAAAILASGQAGTDPGVHESQCQQAAAALSALQNAPGAADALAQALGRAAASEVQDVHGIRLLCDTRRWRVEPCVLDPGAAALYARRLDSSRPSKYVAASGIVQIDAKVSASPAHPFVSVRVDQQALAAANMPPYRFAWDTTKVADGPHLVSVQTSTGGAALRERSTWYWVTNEPAALVTADPGSGQASDFADTETAIWRVGALRVSHKSLNYLLSDVQQQHGLAGAAQNTRLLACAMDINYRYAKQYLRRALAPSGAPRPAEVWQGSRAGRRLALTFDDGPSTKTAALLDVLKQYRVPATFFVVGSRAAEAPALVASMAAAGHEIENHSYSHPNLVQCTPYAAETEIVQASVLIHALTGRRPRYLRPPGGNTNTFVQHCLQFYGLTGGYWTIDGFNKEESGSVDSLTAYVIAHLQPGAIILLHNGAGTTIRALPEMVRQMRARGYTLVTLASMGWSPVDRKAARVRE